MKIKLKKILMQIAFNLHPKSIKASVTYSLAKRKAELLHKQLNGQRAYVLCDDDGKLVITNKKGFYHLTRNKKINKSITPQNLHINSLYYTAGRFCGFKGGKFQNYMMKPMSPVVVRRKKQLYKKFMRDR